MHTLAQVAKDQRLWWLFLVAFLVVWHGGLGAKVFGLDDPQNIYIDHKDGFTTTITCKDPSHGIITCPHEQLILGAQAPKENL